ncbi:hypothetical protein [Streptomyces sp. NPDC088762]|uniref:hypothetical protein n=1 Tax=Streptomyces sp. NPDC088762 TaxID=3365891 RepID=UPI0038006E29
MTVNTPQPQPEPQPPVRQSSAGNPGADPVVLLLLALVVTLLLGAVAYVVFVHPRLANPVMAAAAVAAPLVAVLIAVLVRRRR